MFRGFVDCGLRLCTLEMMCGSRDHGKRSLIVVHTTHSQTGLQASEKGYGRVRVTLLNQATCDSCVVSSINMQSAAPNRGVVLGWSCHLIVGATDALVVSVVDGKVSLNGKERTIGKLSWSSSRMTLQSHHSHSLRTTTLDKMQFCLKTLVASFPP